MSKLLSSVVLLLLAAFAVAAQAGYSEFHEFMKLRPLVSGRADVERLAAQLRLPAPENDIIEIGNAEFRFDYAEGSCHSDAWNAKADSLVEIKVFFDDAKRPKAGELGFVTARMKQFVGPKSSRADLESFGGVFYDLENGVLLRLEEGRVIGVVLFPPRDVAQRLCPRYSKQVPAARRYNGWLRENFSRVFLPIQEYEVIGGIGLEVSSGMVCSASSDAIVSVGVKSDPSLVYSFDYDVSGGKIVGKGSEVKWDLTGLPAGTYVITATVHGLCKPCGKAKTETVTVKDCAQK